MHLNKQINLQRILTKKNKKNENIILKKYLQARQSLDHPE